MIWSVPEIVAELSTLFELVARRPDLHRHAGRRRPGRSAATASSAASTASRRCARRSSDRLARGDLDGTHALHVLAQLRRVPRPYRAQRSRAWLTSRCRSTCCATAASSARPTISRSIRRASCPALGHDGALVSQSLAICEYLEEIQPEPRLLPGSALDRAQIRAHGAGGRLRHPSAQQPARAAYLRARVRRRTTTA